MGGIDLIQFLSKKEFASGQSNNCQNQINNMNPLTKSKILKQFIDGSCKIKKYPNNSYKCFKLNKKSQPQSFSIGYYDNLKGTRTRGISNKINFRTYIRLQELYSDPPHLDIIKIKNFMMDKPKKFNDLKDKNYNNILDIFPDCYNQGRMGTCYAAAIKSILLFQLGIYLLAESGMSSQNIKIKLEESIPSIPFIVAITKYFENEIFNSIENTTWDGGSVPIGMSACSLLGVALEKEIPYSYIYKDYNIELNNRTCYIHSEECTQLLINGLCPPSSESLIWALTGIYNNFTCYPCCPREEIDLIARSGAFSSQLCVDFKPQRGLSGPVNWIQDAKDRIELYKFYLYFGFAILIGIPIFENWYQNNNFNPDKDEQKLQVTCITLPIMEDIKKYRNDCPYYYEEAAKSIITSDKVFKTPDYLSGGHAVVIVGWNDEIDFGYKIKYQNNQEIKIPGAFIIRNSWGDDTGINGYLYFPYAWIYLYISDPNYFSYLDFVIIEKETFRTRNVFTKDNSYKIFSISLESLINHFK